jgi:hypothetical protein
MKANELRIGNWVNFTKSPFIDELGEFQISGDGIMYYEKSLNDDKDFIVEPIPLTEEWLLSFGAKESGETAMRKFFELTSGSFVFIIELTHDNTVDEIVCINTSRGGKIYLDNLNLMTKVHQFQNLHFALTGEELKGGSNV